MAETAPKREEYTVTISGLEHTVLLTAEDAERYGDAAVPSKKKAAPSNKSATPENK